MPLAAHQTAHVDQRALLSSARKRFWRPPGSNTCILPGTSTDHRGGPNFSGMKQKRSHWPNNSSRCGWDQPRMTAIGAANS